MAVCEVTVSAVKKVLVVDDDELIRALVCRFLAKRQLEAHSATNGVHAMEFLSQGFDIVITDYSMPKMNGIEFTRLVRDSYPGVIVIGMSGHGPAERDFMKAGACAFLRKPFFLHDVLRTIDEVSPQ